MAHLETSLAEAERLLTRSTRDYLQLRHESLSRQRSDTEAVEALRRESSARKADAEQARAAAAAEVSQAASKAKRGAEQYVALFRQQAAEAQREANQLREREGASEQALTARVKELEATLVRLRRTHSSLEERRRLEAEGYGRELAELRKAFSRLELRVYAGRNPDAEPPPPQQRAASARAPAGGKAGPTRRQLTPELAAMRERMAALERAIM
mmetsp:Transcript_22496/g.74580  ORF Transcript_22496/g.74580 Transcript_22496/m.74580 type:complete len:213 (-) Transcript_22496:217-855(-)